MIQMTFVGNSDLGDWVSIDGDGGADDDKTVMMKTDGDIEGKGYNFMGQRLSTSAATKLRPHHYSKL